MTVLLHDRSRGFTLIELLVAVAVVGILASIAIPGYGAFLSKGRITTAQADLVALSLNFENQYQRVLAYPTVNYDNTAAVKTAFGKWKPASEESLFSFLSTDASSSAYTLKATGLGTGDISGCIITLTSSGDKSITDCEEFSAGEWL